MDSSVSPTHGEQENSVWNGHYACTCYHPLFVFNQFGDLERCALRPGNVHSAGAISRQRFRASISGPTPALPIPRSMSFSKRSGSSMRSGCQRTGSYRAESAVCSSALSGDLRTRCVSSMPISAIRLEAGRSGRGYHAGCSPPTNAVRLQLHALVYNLGILRTLATPEPIRDWSLTSLKENMAATSPNTSPKLNYFWPSSALE